MLFEYKIVDQKGVEKEGRIEAINEEIAISSLQDRGYIITYINPAEKKGLLNIEFTFFKRLY